MKKVAKQILNTFSEFKLGLISQENTHYPPKDFCLTTQEWIDQDLAINSNSQAKFYEVHPASLIKRHPPQTLDDSVHSAFIAEYQYDLPATFFAVIPQGYVWGTDGAIITPDSTLLWDLSRESSNEPRNHSIFQKRHLPPPHKLEGTAAVISSMYASASYFHWMLDALPRIGLLKQYYPDWAGIDYVIINSYESRFGQETLTALAIPAEKIIESKKYPHIQADRLLVPSYATKTGNSSAWVCEFLQKSFLMTDSTKNSDLPKRLYISRAKARGRKVLNEDELVIFLSKLGFQTVFLENLSVHAQAQLFSQAEVVIAPHGAGLTNLAFCQPKTQIIELFSPHYVNVCFWALSDQLGLKYSYWIMKDDIPKNHFIVPQLKNIIVDIASISKLLELNTIVSQS